jgi:hypothetical protein
MSFGLSFQVLVIVNDTRIDVILGTYVSLLTTR